MSVQNQVIACLGGLILVGAIVFIWAYYPTEARVRRAAQVIRHRRGQVAPPRQAATGPMEMLPVHPAEEVAANFERADEPAGQVVVVPPPAPAVAPWLVTALPNEPTPLFDAPGKHRYPDDLEILSFTKEWNRDELIARIRRAEAEQAGVEAA